MPSTRQFDAVLYGATGFTGKLIAHYMEKRKLSFAIAGRNEEKLKRLSASMVSRPPVLVAHSDDASALEAMASKARVVVSAAGPFCEFGMPLVQAAVQAKTHYLDTTGEQAFVRQVAETLDGPAKKAGVAVAPAMGFDVVPGDVAALFAAEALGHGKAVGCRSIEIIYWVHAGKLTRGTTRSLLGVTASHGFAFRNRRYEEVAAGERSLDVVFPSSKNPQRAIFLPLAETVSVARALNVDTVETFMVLPKTEEMLSKMAGPMLRPLLQIPGMKRLMDRAIDTMPEGPSVQDRAKFQWQIMANVTSRDGGKVSVVASGKDTYGMTGELLALYASLLSQPGFKGAGVLSPCRLLPPEKALEGLHDFPIAFSKPLVPSR